ncbi:MAG: cytochrome C [Pyrinomonadaceae bacterium]
MKRQLLLCTLLLLASVTLLVVSPSVIAGFSKTNYPVVSGHMAQPGLMILDNDESIIQRGFDIAPVLLNLNGKNRALVGLGSYIVNTGGCNDCHTNPSYVPGGDPFAGEPEQINVNCYLSGGTDFGPFRSRNLTPDANGLPAGLTLEEFIHVLRTGEDTTSPFDPPFDGGLLQVMPWPVFGKKTTRDLTAVYEYLRAIPHRSRCLTPAP